MMDVPCSPGRIVQQLAHDSEGHLTTVRDGAGNITTYDYGLDDPAKLYPGQLNSVQYPTYSVRYGYDKRDRLTRTTEEYDGTSRAAFTTYDAAGNLDTVIDAKERTTDYDYDELGRLKSELDPAGGTTDYTYDDRDNLLSVTNARGVVIRRYEYDRKDRLTKEIRPDDTFYRYVYDDATGTVERFDAKGQKTRYLRDAAGRLATVEYYAAGAADPSKTVTFSYDERGLLTGYDDGTTSASYTYDLLGRKKTETVNYGTFTLGYSYTYDKAGRKTSFTGPDSVTVTYGYDDAGRPSTISLPGVGTFAYTEFRWQRPAKLTLPGGGAREWHYDGLMRPSQIVGRDPAGNPVLDYGYGYDAVDNIERKTTEHGEYAYTYDELDRLTGADNPSLADEAYTYDEVGNRKTDAGTTGEWTYSTSDELEGYDGVVLNYDDNGSLTQKDDNGTITKYVYNLENRLAEVRDEADALIASYYYDPFGRRLWKEVGGTRTYFLYSDEGVIAEADSAGNVTRQYGWKRDGTWGTDPLYLKVAGKTYFYQNDHLGTPQKLVGSNGAVVWAARYQSFGAVQADVALVENPLRFPGQYFDGETGLHYNYFRDYDPTNGRYIESDPIGLKGGLNTYAYVYNNPIMFYDPYGLWAFGDPLPQGLVDFSAGFGDTISFGLTDWVRDQMGTNGAVNKCSGGYSAGEWAGIGYGFAAGGAAGWRAAGQKAAGKEFSHWIPNRMGGPRSKWNGNYVTPGRHYKHDPYRYPPRSQRSGDKWPAAMQQLDRIPNVYKGAAAGGGAAGASAASNGCECQ